MIISLHWNQDRYVSLLSKQQMLPLGVHVFPLPSTYKEGVCFHVHDMLVLPLNNALTSHDPSKMFILYCIICHHFTTLPKASLESFQQFLFTEWG